MATASTQRLKPPQSSSITSSSDNRPTVVFCSNKDDHLLSQDICILCGSLGKDDEGNLIACAQCGQCYHPYCVNIKGLKVVISKGWRCLDCTVCETCGQPGDEGKLLLCDECELSYHTYCLSPPLEDVPQDAWKCHWCVVCQKCKSHSPGVNSEWQKNYTECGPCASKNTCPKCHIDYSNNDLILKCTNCSRWLHAECDSIYDEEECELAIELGYSCLFCRPDEQPLFAVQRKTISTNRNKNNCTITNQHEEESRNHDTIDDQKDMNIRFKSSTIGQNDHQSKHLSESPRPQSAPLSVNTELASHSIKRPASSLQFAQNDVKSEKSDGNNLNLNDSNAEESNVKSSSIDHMDDLVQGLHMVDGVYLSEVGLAYIKSQKIEPAKRQRAKRGAKMQKLDDCGNVDDVNKDDDEENKSHDKTDDDVRKKRVRKLSKAGVGGFSVRQRGVRIKDEDFNYSLNNDTFETSTSTPPHQAQQQLGRDQSGETSSLGNSKPKRVRKKPRKKNNLLDQYPSYLQEAFFGKTLLSHEQQSNDEKVNELNDCSNIDLERRDVHKTNNEDSTNTNQIKSNNKFGDIKKETVVEPIENRAAGDNQLINKDGDLMDVFIRESRPADDSSENRRDFDPDLLTDFNLDIDPLDSKVVEDLLNGLGGTQQSIPNPVNDSNSSSVQPQILSPSIRSMSETSLHYENSPQHMIHPQTPSPRMQFNRPQLQQHPMVQVTKVRPTMDPNRMQPSDPYSITPHTPRPIPMPQRSPFSPQSPYPPHPMSANPSTPPITPRTPGEQLPLYQNNQHITPMMQSQQVQQQIPFVDSHQSHVPQPSGQYQHQHQARPTQIPQHQLQHHQVPQHQVQRHQVQQQHQHHHQQQQPSQPPPQQQPQPHFSNQQQPRVEPPKQNPTKDWETEESLGDKATKSAVLYANIEHPDLKHRYRTPDERYKQIQKLWRQLKKDERNVYVEKARENRSASKVKPMNEKVPVPKKAESPMEHQSRPPMSHENMSAQSQQVHMVQSPMISQSQDTRWKQPMPVDNQSNRFAQSPHQQSHHIIHETSVVQPMSPAIRPMMEPHFEPSPQQMIPPQTPSPQMQYPRPPMQQHSTIQVSRVRPPTIDPNRAQPVDPYSMPPSTPRPMVQQRSPFSPQSPFPPHSGVVASSTPPITPRTPNEHSPMYQTNQHPSMVPNQPQTHQQQSFAEQQSGQYSQLRQTQYPSQPRLAGPVPVQQYNNSPVSGPQPMRVSMNPQIRSQLPSQQQPIYQQQQYRQNQPVRYVSQHQDPHQHAGSPMQQNLSPQQHMQQQRLQRPVMPGQMAQQTVGAPRVVAQPRPVQQQMMQSGHVQIQHMQPQHTPHQPIAQPQQHHAIQTQPMQQLHQQVQHQQQLGMQQAPNQQGPQQMHYSNVQVSTRIDTDDPTQLLDDEDALKDLGADFNILEFADPEPDKGASTSSGKNNIDLDPEFEDFFDDRETLEEKRVNEQLVSMNMQQPVHQVPQHHQQQQQSQGQLQQVANQPMHQTSAQQHIPVSQSFVDSQPQQHVGLQNSVVQQQQQVQYSPSQRQPVFVNQQRVPTSGGNQYISNQSQMVRPQQVPAINQVRMQHPQQQQMSYNQNRPQQPARYHSPIGHDMHQQQHMHPQQHIQQNHMSHQPQPNNQQQIQRVGSQMQPQPQYQNQTNFVDSQPQQPQQQSMQGGQMHHHQHPHHHHQPQQQQQMQYSQVQQQNIVYGNHQQQNPQYNQPRRQFQAMPQQQQQQQPQHQNYGYQQQPMPQHHQQNYQTMNNNQQMMKVNNDMMIHDKNPIIGDPITSMEFTMYEQGSGANNEAANFYELSGTSGTSQERPPLNMDSTDDNQDILIRNTDQPAQSDINAMEQDQQLDSLLGGLQENMQDNLNSGNKFVSTSTGRVSSCSNPQDVESNSSANANPERTGNNVQGQNQLLKQLLATCPASDGPNQERSSSAPINDAAGKMLINTAGNSSNISKQSGSGIPTISFQMDSSNKVVTSSSVLIQPQVSIPTPIRTSTTGGPSFQARPSITSTGTAPSSNFEIKTYNVGQQVQNSAASNIAPVARISHIPTPISSMSTGRTQTTDMPVSSLLHAQDTSMNDSKPFGGSSSNFNPTGATEQPSVKANIPSTPSDSADKSSQETLTPAQSKAAAKISAAKQRKSDYMAKRRADLEKEPTPPPREVKPKKRVRGPNKRSRVQSDNDDFKTNDSNSNTSETSQQVNGTTSAPPRKRVRKSQKAKPDESMLSTFAYKLHNDLPAVTIQEPIVRVNTVVNSLFACGDLASKSSKLRGQYGMGVPVNETMADQSHNKSRRKIIGYYHEEFPKELINKPIDSLDDRLIPRMFERECDSPSSIISASSSDHDESDNEWRFDADEDGLDELYTPDLNKFRSPHKVRNILNQESLYNGNRIDINNNARSMSPSIPIEIKLPVIQGPVDSVMNQLNHNKNDSNKENFRNSQSRIDDTTHRDPSAQCSSDQTSTSLNMRLKDHGNVSLTMTLTSQEADGVKRVLSKLPNLIDNSAQSVAENGDNKSIETRDNKTTLSGSLRLLTGASSSTPETGYGHSELKFNELNYVLMETDDASATIVDNQSGGELADVKPEFCCRCKAIVIDRGIRKIIAEIPDQVKSSMDRSLMMMQNRAGELIFCSVDCYASSLMSSDHEKSNDVGTQPSQFDNEINDLSDSIRANNKRKWDGVLYTRWTPTYFEVNKTTSPVNDDIKDSAIMDSSTFTPSSSAQFINNGDSSVDSNESDNSTSYSQSTSGKLGNSLDSPFNNTQDVATSYISFRGSTKPKDTILPWPEGLDLIQVKPFKPLKKKASPDLAKDGVQDSERIAEMYQDDADGSERVVEMYEDARKCVLCHEFGDGDSDGPARLLNLFIDGWVHLNCALWSPDVYELANGALMNVELACRKAMTCSLCRKPGATLKCFKPRCPNYYHFVCALKERCSFYEDKSVQCRQHSKSSVKEMTSFIVKRKVYINRDEQTQVAEMIQSEKQYVMRVGGLVFLNIGQLLPHQLAAFHDRNNIFPVGFKIIRYYWSYRQFNKRCKYFCTIDDNDGRPMFRIVAQEFGFDDEEFVGDSAENVWRPIIDMIVRLREAVPDTITTFPAYIRGEDLFGLNEPSIVRILESLPGVETLTDYDFKFGRSPLLELPLAINPTGCARTEPKLRTHFKRPYTIHTANNVTKSRLQSLNSSDSSSPYIKQFVHSKSSQYRKMKSEWRNNVVLARSSVQGLGLYAARDIEKHTMVIEYIGMLIRNEIAERYERIHEANNRGIYMFRLDEDRVIDATLAGGLARYINHSCNPNCVAEAVEIDRERKILIIANRKILKGEELGYDYKLAIEDDQHKISCLCGAPTCKKWMN